MADSSVAPAPPPNFVFGSNLADRVVVVSADGASASQNGGGVVSDSQKTNNSQSVTEGRCQFPVKKMIVYLLITSSGRLEVMSHFALRQ